MARRKGGSRKGPGRETPGFKKSGLTAAQFQRSKHSPEHRARLTTKSQARILAGILDDRVKFLRSVAKKTVTFKTERDAKRFANNTEDLVGLTYRVKGKTTTLGKIDRDAVKDSSEFKRILRDLKSRSKSARGRKAKALEELGRRETWYDFAVGDTNED